MKHKKTFLHTLKEQRFLYKNPTDTPSSSAPDVVPDNSALSVRKQIELALKGKDAATKKANIRTFIEAVEGPERVERMKIAVEVSREVIVLETCNELIRAELDRLTEREQTLEKQSQVQDGVSREIDERLLQLAKEKDKFQDLLVEVLHRTVAKKPETTPSVVTTEKEERIPVVSAVGDVVESGFDKLFPKSKLSRKEKITRTILATVGTAAVVAGGIFLLKKIFGKAKSAVEAGQNAASQTSGGFMKKLAIGGVAAVALLVGGKLAYDFIQKKFGLGGVAEKAKELYEKYGLEKAQYMAGLAAYHAGQIDMARDVWGDKADVIIADLKAQEAARQKREEESGIKFETADVALVNYGIAINKALMPFRHFCSENKEALLLAAGGTAIMSSKVRSVILNSASLTKDGVVSLLEFFGGFAKDHPIMSILSAYGAIKGVQALGDVKIPKDPENLQKFYTSKVDAVGKTVTGFNDSLPSVSDEHWNMIAGILTGSSDSLSQLIESTASLLGNATESTVSWAAESRFETIENKNKYGFVPFLNALERMKENNNDLESNFNDIKSYIDRIEYPLKSKDITKITELAKLFDVIVRPEGKYIVYDILDEDYTYHTMRLCVNPSLSEEDQFNAANHFIVDRNSVSESLQQVLTVPWHASRQLLDDIAYKNAETEEEATGMLEREMNDGATIAVEGLYAYIIRAGEGGVKKYTFGPLELFNQLIYNPFWKGEKPSMTEAAKSYADGIIPVAIFGTASALARGKWKEAFSLRAILWNSLAYPIEATITTGKVGIRSVGTPMWKNFKAKEFLFKDVMKDPLNMVSGALKERYHNLIGLPQRNFLRGKNMVRIGHSNGRIGYLYEAKKLVARANYSFFDKPLLEAAHDALIHARMPNPPKPEELVDDLSRIDDEITRQKRIIQEFSTSIDDVLKNTNPSVEQILRAKGGSVSHALDQGFSVKDVCRTLHNMDSTNDIVKKDYILFVQEILSIDNKSLKNNALQLLLEQQRSADIVMESVINSKNSRWADDVKVALTNMDHCPANPKLFDEVREMAKITDNDALETAKNLMPVDELTEKVDEAVRATNKANEATEAAKIATEDAKRATRAAGASRTTAESTEQTTRATKAATESVEEVTSGTRMAAGAEGSTPSPQPNTRTAPIDDGSALRIFDPDAAPAALADSLAPARNAEALDPDWIKMLKDVKKSRIASGIEDDAAKALSATFDDAAKTCFQYGINLKDTKNILQNSETLALIRKVNAGGDADNMARLAITTAADVGGDTFKTLQRMATFISVTEKASSSAVKEANVLKQIATMDDLSPSAIRRLFGTKEALMALDAAEDSTAIIRSLKNLSAWSKASNLSRGLHVGFVGFDALMLGVDTYVLIQMQKRMEETKKALAPSLVKAGFINKGNGVFKHKSTGEEISISVMKKSVDTIDDAQKGVVALDALSVIGTIAIGMNPVGGAVLAAVVIGGHFAAAMADRNAARAIIENMPASLLATLGVDRATQKGSHELHQMYSYEWFESKKDNEEALKKLTLVTFYSELQKMQGSNPGMYEFIMRDMDAGSFLNEEHSEIFVHGFDDILKPYIAARMYQRSNDGSNKWENFQDLRIREGWVFDWENVSEEDKNLIMRDAVSVYFSHLAEKKHAHLLETRKIRETRTRDVNAPLRDVTEIEAQAELQAEHADLERRIQESGNMIILGNPLRELERTDGKTHTQELIEAYIAKLNSGDSYYVSGTRGNRGGLYKYSYTVHKRRDQRLKEDPHLFDLELPDGVLPHLEGKRRTVNIRDLSSVILGREVNPEQYPESYSLVLNQARNIFDDLKFVGTVCVDNSRDIPVWQPGPEHFIAMDEFSRILSQNNHLDPNTRMQDKIAKLRKKYWGKANITGYGGYRAEEFKSLVHDLEIYINYLEEHKYYFDPLEKPEIGSSDNATIAPVGFERYLPEFENKSTVHVELPSLNEGDVNMMTFVGADGEKTTYSIPGYGELICESTWQTVRGTKVPRYSWYFTATNEQVDSSQLYIYSTQVKRWATKAYEAATRLGLKPHYEKDGSLYFTRAGKKGKYFLQDDGTIYAEEYGQTFHVECWTTLGFNKWNYHYREDWRTEDAIDSVPQSGVLIEIKEPEDIIETIPDGQDWFLYHEPQFTMQVELTDGKVISVSNKVQGGKLLLDGVNEELDGLVKVESERVVDTSGRILWSNKDGKPYYNWKMQKGLYAWRVTILDPEKVKDVTMTSKSQDRKDSAGQKLIVDVASSTCNQAETPDRVLRLQEEIDVDSQLFLDKKYGGICVPHSTFNITLTLRDGTKVTGSNRYPKRLHDHLNLEPRDTKNLPVNANLDEDAQGWYMKFKNRKNILDISVNYPTKDGETKEYRVFTETPKELAIRKSGLQRVSTIIDDGSDTRIGQLYTMPNRTGDFIVLDDGSLVWSGGKEPGSDIEYTPRVYKGKDVLPLKKSHFGQPIQIFSSKIALRVHGIGKMTTVILDPEKEAPTLEGMQITKNDDNTWTIIPSNTIGHCQILDPESEESLMYQFTESPAIRAQKELPEQNDVEFTAEEEPEIQAYKEPERNEYTESIKLNESHEYSETEGGMFADIITCTLANGTQKMFWIELNNSQDFLNPSDDYEPDLRIYNFTENDLDEGNQRDAAKNLEPVTSETELFRIETKKVPNDRTGFGVPKYKFLLSIVPVSTQLQSFEYNKTNSQRGSDRHIISIEK